MTRGSGRSDSFERYYLRHVAVNEGCGCAEQAIRRDRGEAGPKEQGGSLLPAPLGMLSRLFRTRLFRTGAKHPS